MLTAYKWILQTILYQNENEKKKWRQKMANDVEWLECSEWFVQSHHIHWNVSDDLFMSQFFYAQIGRERKMWLSFLCYGANLDVILSFRVSHHVENWSFFVSLAGKVITSIHFNRTQKKCVCVEACTHEHVFFSCFFPSYARGICHADRILLYVCFRIFARNEPFDLFRTCEWTRID